MSAEISEAEILSAHAVRDYRRLAALYLAGAHARLAKGGEAEAAFLFTQAYIFALDAGDEESAAAAHVGLVELGRDT